MNRFLVGAIAVVGFGVAQGAAARDTPNSSPVEFFACNFKEGKDMKDLKKMADDFSKWAESNNGSYSAWLLTPQFFNEQDMFDVGWLGSWPDGEAFGVGQEKWLTEGGELASAFAEVVDCDNHIMALSQPINAPESTPEDGVLLVYECSLNDGKTLEQAYAAHLESGEAMKAKGSLAVSWFYTPVLGVGEPNFDYWHLVGFYRYSDLGATMEMYVNKGGEDKARKLIGTTSSCRTPDVYDVTSVRVGG
jgi:hypothetical protein